LEAKLSPQLPDAEALVAAGFAASAMQDYSRRTTRFIKAQNLELQAIIAMLVENVIDLGPPNGRSIPVLRDLGSNLGKASMLEEIQTLTPRFSECLDAIRIEAGQRRRAVTPAREPRSSEEPAAVAESGISQELIPHLDPATKLPVRAEAEAAIREMMQNGKDAFAVIFIVERVHAINTRFGCSVGDQVMLAFLERLT